MKRFVAFLSAFAVIPASGGRAEAQTGTASPGTSLKTVTFDHRGSPYQLQNLLLRDREKFQLKILSTCPADFTYEVINITPSPPPAAATPARTTSGRPKLEDKVVATVEFDGRHSGYILNARKIATSSTCFSDDAADKPIELASATFVVAVKAEAFALAFAGGFSVSKLHDRVFAVREAEPGVKRVFREADKEDKVSLGLAALIHLYHERVPAAALSFGLGVRNDNKAHYYLGLSWRFGDQAAITAGFLFGSVTRLPIGIGEGSVVKDDNVIQNLGSYTVGKPFIALSYTFLGTSDRFKKPLGIQ